MARPVSFSADQIVTIAETGQQIVSRCHFAPDRYRAETTVAGRTLVTIGRKDLGRAWVLSPSRRQFREVPLEGTRAGAVLFNPSRERIVKRLGADRLEGYRCEKLRVRASNGDRGEATNAFLTVWVSERLPVPLRTRTDRGTVMEYRNIEEGPQPACLFELPTGYARVDGGFAPASAPSFSPAPAARVPGAGMGPAGRSAGTDPAVHGTERHTNGR